MKRSCSTLVFSLFALVAGAAEVKWTATGTVGSVSGTGFAGTGVTAGDAVELEMTYDSNAEVKALSFLPILGAINGRAQFIGDIDLSVRVLINGQEWSGELPTTVGSLNVLSSNCWDFAGNPDVFSVDLDTEAGGTFPSFPVNEEGLSKEIRLEFADRTSPAELFEVHVLPDNLSQVCEMTSATGSVSAGTSTIAFTLDPETVRITLPPVPASISKVEGGIQMTWDSEVGKSYRLEGTSDLKVWSIEGVYGGTGLPLQPILNPFGTYDKRFYRVVEQ